MPPRRVCSVYCCDHPLAPVYGVGYSWVDGLKAHAAKARLCFILFFVICGSAHGDVAQRHGPLVPAENQTALNDTCVQLEGYVVVPARVDSELIQQVLG